MPGQANIENCDLALSEVLMAGAAGLITHPIALCAYVLSLVFGLLARMWSSKGRKSFHRQLFHLAVFVSVTALVGGLILAWYQTARAPSSASEPAAKNASTSNPTGSGATSVPAVSQTSSGPNSSNVQNSGSGSVTVQYGSSNPQNPPAKQPEKK
jgi:glucan phosphoethanolaminetransferase (alkaline phosphatase superfamily)